MYSKKVVCVCGWYSNGVPPFFQKDLSNAQFRIQNRSLLVKRKWHLQKPFIRVFTFCRFYNEIIRKQKECALYFSVAWNGQILKKDCITIVAFPQSHLFAEHWTGSASIENIFDWKIISFKKKRPKIKLSNIFYQRCNDGNGENLTHFCLPT